jgi:hypothetical protein
MKFFFSSSAAASSSSPPPPPPLPLHLPYPFLFRLFLSSSGASSLTSKAADFLMNMSRVELPPVRDRAVKIAA